MFNSFKSLSDIISKDENFENFRKAAKEADVIEKFKEIFPELIKVVEVKKIEKKNLFVKVENSVWRNELQFRNKLMIEKINKYFNHPVIEKITFL